MLSKRKQILSFIRSKEVIFGKGPSVSMIAEKYQVSEYYVERLINEESDRFDLATFTPLNVRG